MNLPLSHPKLILSLNRLNKVDFGQVKESKTIRLYWDCLVLFSKLKPDGRVGRGHNTVTLFDLDNSVAISWDICADTTGSGGKTAEIINILDIFLTNL